MAFKIRVKIWILIIIALGFICFLFVFPESRIHDTLLRYFSTVLSWPFVLFIFILLLFLRHRQALDEVIKSGVSLKRGETEIQIKGQQLSLKAEDGASIEDLKGRIIEIDQKLQAQLGKPEKDWVHLFAAWVFERQIRYMYQSQYNLIKFLKQVGSWPLAQCYEIFYKQQYLIKFKGNPSYTFDSYLNFLAKGTLFVEVKLIENSNSLLLTPLGIAFIDYCDSMKYSEAEFVRL